MPLIVRYMRLADIPPVIAIDRQSFDPAWSEKSYAFEISESTYSHMVVLETVSQVPAVSGWRRFFRPPAADDGVVLAYGGLWNIAGEGHISTIATRPDQRGQGYGELVLCAMIRRAITLNAQYVVLEVRVSNAAAQSLYHRHGFTIVATKPNYYHNNNEDAYDMRLPLHENPAYVTQFNAFYAALIARRAVIDEYTQGIPARKG